MLTSLHLTPPEHAILAVWLLQLSCHQSHVIDILDARSFTHQPASCLAACCWRLLAVLLESSKFTQSIGHRLVSHALL